MRQASEQYLIESQFFAQDFRQVIARLQTTQILLGKYPLFPLKVVVIDLPITHSDWRAVAEHAKRSPSDRHR